MFFHSKVSIQNVINFNQTNYDRLFYIFFIYPIVNVYLQHVTVQYITIMAVHAYKKILYFSHIWTVQQSHVKHTIKPQTCENDPNENWVKYIRVLTLLTPSLIVLISGLFVVCWLTQRGKSASHANVVRFGYFHKIYRWYLLMKE
jgi:hypothetical protein